MTATTVRTGAMDAREALEFSHLDEVDDTDTNMVLRLAHTKIDMGTTFSKMVDKLEEVLVVARQAVEKIIVATRGWIATEIEPTWTRCEMRHLQDSRDQRSYRNLITGRHLIKIKTTDG